MIKDRITFIRKLKSEDWTNEDIANQLGLTAERVRQLSLSKLPESFCKTHQKRYILGCALCTAQKKYKVKLEAISKSLEGDGLLKEIKRLSKVGRKLEYVVQKKEMVKLLRDKFKLSYLVIGHFLNKDHSTIIHHYKS